MKLLLTLLLLASTSFARDDFETFRRIYDKDRIVEKKEIWQTLSKDEQIGVRRINFAWASGYLSLNPAQIDFLTRFSSRLPFLTDGERDDFRDEAALTFPHDASQLLFGSIGPFKSCKNDIVFISYRSPFQPNNCPCSVGSGFNMSCDGECTPAGGQCTVTAEGCGFAWLYRCDGTCTLS